MGRMSLIVVLGFIIIAGFVFQAVYDTDLRSVENIAKADQVLNTDFTSKDIVNYAIENNILNNRSKLDTSWFGVQVKIEVLNPTQSTAQPPLYQKIVRGISKKGNIIDTMDAIVTYRNAKIPSSSSPISIHSPLLSLSMEGPAAVNGFDYDHPDIDIPGYTPGADSMYGITLSQADTAMLKNGLIADSNHTKVNGMGGYPSVTEDANYVDIAEYVDLYGSVADTSVTTGQFPPGTYGTVDNPKIVYLDGDTQLSGDVNGTGVLVINGDFSTTDTSRLDWNGIILAKAADDSNNVKLHFADSSSVKGSMMVDAPNESDVNMKGEKVPFELTESEIIPGEDYEASITVLGSELSGNGGVGDVATEVNVYIGGNLVKSWDDARYSEGDADVDGAWQPPLSSFYWKAPETYAAGTAISISGRFYSSYYGINKTISSTDNTDHLRVLRTGDSQPGMAGSSGQSDVESFLEGYIVDGQINLLENQAIFLIDYNQLSNDYPYDDFWEFRIAHDDHWDPYYHDENPEYEDYVALYGDPNQYYADYDAFLGSWKNDGIPPDDYVPEHNVEEEDYAEDKADWYAANDNRDFQDLVVLADLQVPPEPEPDTTQTVVIETRDKEVRFQYCQEAYIIARQLLESKLGGTGKAIVKVDWIDKNPYRQ